MGKIKWNVETLEKTQLPGIEGGIYTEQEDYYKWNCFEIWYPFSSTNVKSLV